MQFVSTRLAAQIQRRTEAHAYTDLAYYLPASDPDTVDSYGQPTASTALIPMSCSFTNKPNTETWREMDVENVEAEIRFATPTPDKGGRIRITQMFGAPVTNKTFEIIGIQKRGAFGYVCALKAVTI